MKKSYSLEILVYFITFFNTKRYFSFPYTLTEWLQYRDIMNFAVLRITIMMIKYSIVVVVELEPVFCRLYFWWAQAALFQDDVKLLKAWIYRNTISVFIVPYIITMSNFDIYFFIFEFTRINALQDDKFTQTQWRSYFLTDEVGGTIIMIIVHR